MSIRIFVTGGTIDCNSISEGEVYEFTETKVPKMLEQSRVTAAALVQVLFLKDSIYTTDQDRAKVVDECIGCEEDKIVITHGTDTMPLTANVLGEKIKDKTIVLLGAMTPYNQDNSDALFNFGAAITAVQILNPGVYITMNGRVFNYDNVRKNKDDGVFENIL